MTSLERERLTALFSSLRYVPSQGGVMLPLAAIDTLKDALLPLLGFESTHDATAGTYTLVYPDASYLVLVAFLAGLLNGSAEWPDSDRPDADFTVQDYRAVTLLGERFVQVVRQFYDKYPHIYIDLRMEASRVQHPEQGVLFAADHLGGHAKEMSDGTTQL